MVRRTSVRPGRRGLTARVKEERQQSNDVVADIERLPAGDPGREARVQRAFELIRLRALGTTWAAVRQTAPTQPHPVIPRRPPGNSLLRVPLGNALGIHSSASPRRG